ncbi:hypothetical protein ACFQGT_18685 [Natrialbaceae archaeon GCM10025810]
MVRCLRDNARRSDLKLGRNVGLAQTTTQHALAVGGGEN